MTCFNFELFNKSIQLVGLETCQETIKNMIDVAKAKASVDDACHWMLSPDWDGLDGLGMGLSGCEDELANEHFVQRLLDRYPKLSKSGYATSDTIGSIYTAGPDGEFKMLAQFKFGLVICVR